MTRPAAVLAAALLVTGCIIVHHIEPQFDKDGTVNITIRTDSDDPNVNVAVDDVMVSWDELKQLMEMKKRGSSPPAARGPEAASPAPPAAAVASAAAPSAPPPAAAMTHSVQVGAFLVAQNAREQAAILAARGHAARILEIPDAKGRIWHLVRIGDHGSAEAARAQAEAFRRTEGIPAAVRPYGRF